MENYFKSATTKTPEIEFRTDGVFKISGNSYMEHPIKFYTELWEWVELFLAQNTKPVYLDVYLIYINTTSTKMILKIMNLINASSKSELKITWKYQIDDDQMLELGKDFEKITKHSFDFQGLN
jgi:hypothetical protein